MKVLYVNACVRGEESRTAKLANRLLEKLKENSGVATLTAEPLVIEEVRLLNEPLEPLNPETLAKRTALIEAGDYSDDMFRYAKQFAAADVIVIAAPYWDLNFPALLKIYLENIYVTGIVSQYGADGMPEGMCNAKTLYYVTTAGGPYEPKYSYGLLHDMAVNFFGIGDTKLISADMLDVYGFDPNAIMEKVLREIDNLDI